MLNIVLPIAGRGSRFANVGVTLPKPLIPIHGTPMIEWVTGNVRPRRPHRFIYLCLQAHLDETNLRAELERICPGCVIVPVREVTQGAACTVLLAREFIDNGDPLMLANSDQYVDIDINDYLATQDESDAAGLIMTFQADHPKWSYVGFDADGRVERVVEKEVISNEATVGIYNFARGRDFVRAADRMIADDLRVNGEFYVAPTYNALIAEGARIVVHNVGSEGSGMYGLGIPEDLALFVNEYSHALTHAGSMS
jgi:NDP-sugar pyrophosphorylase family protein